MLKDVGAVGRWLRERDLQPHDLSPVLITEFHNDRLAAGKRKIPSVKSFEPLLRFLREEGLLAEQPASDSPVQRLLADYGSWLVAERGLAQATVIRYENLARRYLELHPVGGEAGDAEVALTGAERSHSCCVRVNGSAWGRPRVGWPNCARC